MSEGGSKRKKAPAPQKPPVHHRQTNPQQHKPVNTSMSSKLRTKWDKVRSLTSTKPITGSIPMGNTPVHRQSGSFCGPADPTRQTNPLHHPTTNISTSSNVMNTPIHTDNTPVHNQSGSLGDPANSTGQMKSSRPPPPRYQHPPSYHQPVPIVAIGNPGSGKSTILNALAGKVLFGSGISLGCGLTNQLEIKEANGRKFIDTPGVADDTYRQAAGDALKKIFYQGGPMKILFFVTQESGRIVAQDVTTMKLVLESVPQIGRNYGIIVNKIPGNVLSQLSDEGNLPRLMVSIYAGIEDRFKNKNTLLLPLNAKLSNIDNAILHPSDIHKDLVDFINSTITEAYITPRSITEIQVDNFEQLSKQVEDLESELKKNQERQTVEIEKLLAQFEIIETEKMKEHEETMKLYNEELQKMKKNVRDKEEDMRDIKQRSEIEKLRQEIKQKEQMAQELHQTINYQQNQIQRLSQRKTTTNRRYKDINLLNLFGSDFGLKNAASNLMARGANAIERGPEVRGTKITTHYNNE